MDVAGRGAEEQASRRARRAAQLRAERERGGAVDEAALERLRRDQRAWAAGAEGERRVAESLGRLERYGWTMLHDVRWPGRRQANIDHIAIGPGGVFVVDAKNWSGDVRVTHEAVRQNGYGRASALEGVNQATAAVAALLMPQHRSAVRGVMCLAGQEDQAVTVVNGVFVCGRWQLPEHLLAMPPRLTVLEVADIARFLAQDLSSNQPRARRADAPAPTSERRPSTRATPRRSAGLAGYVLLAVAAALGSTAGPAGVVALTSMALLVGALWTTISGRRFAFLGSRSRAALAIWPALLLIALSNYMWGDDGPPASLGSTIASQGQQLTPPL